MKLKGEGGTKSMTCGCPETDKAFLNALNLDEAEAWIKQYQPTSVQVTLSRQWLIENYGTDDIDSIRRKAKQGALLKSEWELIRTHLIYPAIASVVSLAFGVWLGLQNCGP